MNIYNIHDITPNKGKIVFDKHLNMFDGIGFTEVKPEEFHKVIDLGNYEGSILFVAYFNSKGNPDLYLGHYE